MANRTALKWAVSRDNVRMQWLAVDLSARLLVGMDVDPAAYTVAPRVFTPENVAGLDLSETGWSDSSWFGGTGYRTSLAALWTR